MKRTILHTVVFSLFCLMAYPAISRLPDVGNLHLNRRVVNERKDGMEATIFLYQNNIRIDSFQTNRIGRFEFFIPLQDSVIMVAYKDGYVSKTVYVDSRVPNDQKDPDYLYPVFIDLYPTDRIPSNIDLNRPVGRIIFSGTQFIYDVDFTKEQNRLLREFVNERKSMRVRNQIEE